jgi:hypothetical protein
MMRTFLLTILLSVVVTGFQVHQRAGLSLGAKSPAATLGSSSQQLGQRRIMNTSFARKESSLTLHLLAEASSETVKAVSFWQNTDVWVFLAGVFPFAWATVEFWRRIMFKEQFGTGSDAIVFIGMDDAPTDSQGRRVLGRGAIIIAYVLFFISFATIGIVLYSVATSSPLPDVLPATPPIISTLVM